MQLGWWDERQCNSAFIQLVGQEGVTSARVTEIPPGKTLPPLKFALDEIIYVVEGRGLTTIWAGEKRPKKTFEWQKHSMFLVPHNYTHQFSNMQGDKPVRLLHYNYMPLTLSGVRDVNFIFRQLLRRGRYPERVGFLFRGQDGSSKTPWTTPGADEPTGTVISFPT